MFQRGETRGTIRVAVVGDVVSEWRGQSPRKVNLMLFNLFRRMLKGVLLLIGRRFFFVLLFT